MVVDSRIKESQLHERGPAAHSVPDTIPAPEGVTAHFLEHDLVVLSFPLPVAKFPRDLTQAERDIAMRVYAGETNEAIARSRNTSENTIGNQLELLYRKLGVSSRAELILLLRGR